MKRPVTITVMVIYTTNTHTDKLPIRPPDTTAITKEATPIR